MCNAKDEFIEQTKDLRVKCARIEFVVSYDMDENELYILKTGYNDVEYEKFLESLDFEYDNGYGSQKLFGLVWFDDGSWLERYEYDGSEQWDLKEYPDIPDECK